MLHTTACPDWERRIVASESLIPCAPLFPDEAGEALEVFKSLRIVDVVGQPTFGEACDDWVFDFVGVIFGAYDRPKNKRFIREFFLLISKKNAKSTIAAGIMLTALIRNWRHSAELIILAPTIEAANNAFKPAADMVRADADLLASEDGGFLHIIENQRTIKHLKTGATLKVLAADSKTVVGKKASFVLIDELWEFGSVANADAMLKEATGGLVSRDEGFVISITTQSTNAPAGVFAEKLKYARSVRDGEIVDPKFLPVIYEFPAAMVEKKAYLDPENFYITNPNLGRSVSREWLEDHLRMAMSGDKGALQTFLSKHLNVEIDTRLRLNRWAGADYWAGAADEELASLPHFDALRALLRRSEAVVIGIDGGGLDDLLGFYAIGREPGEIEVEIKIDGLVRSVFMKRWLGWGHAWCDEGLLTLRPKIRPKLLDLQKDGTLTIVDDALTDLGELAEIVSQVKSSNLLAEVAVDPAGLGELVDVLGDIGVTEDAGLLIGAQQGIGMMNAIKTSERRLKSGLLKHDGSELSAWCVGNLLIEPTATAIRATKQLAGEAKIDVAMAKFNAVTRMSLNPVVQNSSPYERRGLRMV